MVANGPATAAIANRQCVAGPIHPEQRRIRILAPPPRDRVDERILDGSRDALVVAFEEVREFIQLVFGKVVDVAVERGRAATGEPELRAFEIRAEALKRDPRGTRWWLEMDQRHHL